MICVIVISFGCCSTSLLGFHSGSDGNESACYAGALGLIPGSDSWVRKITWRREWQPIPIFVPGVFLGQRSLAGYSPWDHKESDRTE